MKKLSVIMFFLSLIMIGCTEKRRVPDSELSIDSNGLAHYQGNPFTGVAFRIHNNGQINIELGFKDGKKDGVLKAYYPNGVLAEEGTYKDGKKDGVFRNYSREGFLKREFIYKDGVTVNP